MRRRSVETDSLGKGLTSNVAGKESEGRHIIFKKETTKEAEIMKEAAYKEGFEKGLVKLNEKILLLDKEIKHFQEEMKKKIIQISLSAAKKILGEELKLDKTRIVDIVMQSLRSAIQHKVIKIYANKKDLDKVLKIVKKIAL